MSSEEVDGSVSVEAKTTASVKDLQHFTAVHKGEAKLEKSLDSRSGIAKEAARAAYGRFLQTPSQTKVWIGLERKKGKLIRTLFWRESAS